MKKIGIMGGTFNPIHFGHLFLAENACEQIGLDQVLFMPTKNPPHKAKPENLSDQQRADMIALAIQNNPHFELSTMELERKGLTYTADTLTILTSQHPDIEYYFIIGSDSLFMMQNWKDPQTIFSRSTIVVASRDHAQKEQMEQHATYLNGIFSASIMLIEMPTIQISSAIIRDRIVANKTIRYYLPDKVNEYISKNRLYNTKLEDFQE